MARTKIPQQTIPAFAAPGFYFEAIKDGQAIGGKFQNLQLALESIQTWPIYEQHKASIRLGQYV